MATKLQELCRLGQSPWIDFITRDLISSGRLQQYVDEGIRGLTSNPTIFEKAIAGSTDYDQAFRDLVEQGTNVDDFYDKLVIADIQAAADVLRPVYDQSNGGDGFVSLEVLPGLAHDTEKTIEQARKYFKTVGRPNLLIKVPATDEGIPAIRQLISEGINVNITLIFAIEYYEQVMDAYIEGLEQLAQSGRPIDKVASVASFFVSRVDTAVDKRLQQLIDQESDEQQKQALEGLMGKAAIANAKIAYQHFLEKFSGDRWQRLADQGAMVQRPLWASTSTKNPAYSDVMYVDELIGPDTVNTMPPATIEAFEDHGHPALTIQQGLDEAYALMEKLHQLGIDMKQVTDQLQQEGVASFFKSFQSLDKVIHEKQQALQAAPQDKQSAQLDGVEQQVQQRLQQFQKESFGQRLWDRDASLWKDDPAEQEKIRNRLGWLPVIQEMQQQLGDLESFGNEIKDAGFTSAVLCGMGGSSLAPEVFKQTFGSSPGYPALYVLDTTDTDTILSVQEKLDLAHTLFIVSSKSGTTTETLSLYRYFWEQVERAKGGNVGESFIAITDPRTKLAQEGRDKGFRRVFENRADIGGRYSVLSYFGLVPAAIIGLPLRKLLDSASAMAQACSGAEPADRNPGLWLGAVMGEAALAGKNKLTLVASPAIAAFGLWVEQLIAESTGKEGRGILPVDGEPLGDPSVYGNDRLFVHLDLGAPEDKEINEKLDALVSSGHPVVHLRLAGPIDLGGEFVRWEIAVAAAGAILGINPFNEPNVQESKDNTSRLLQEYEQNGRLPQEQPSLTDGSLELYGVQGGSPTDALASFFARAEPGDYVAFMAYVQQTLEVQDALQSIRTEVRNARKVATTLGYGPRFLHSTGQLHKGGPQVGVFVQITHEDERDLQIPGVPYSFNTLKRAQALGDFEALTRRGLPALRIDIKGDLVQGLGQLNALVDDAVTAKS